jgi:hypothetical protein
MTKREKIIVGIMVLTVGYGAIELLLPRAKSVTGATAPQPAENLSVFISKVADAAKSAASESSALIIKKAEAAWKLDPFMVIRKAAPPPAESRLPKDAVRAMPNLVFSGFLEIGSKRLAIINGMEYEAGDRVSPGAFSIKSILPDKVIMTSSQGEVVLPLQESE